MLHHQRHHHIAATMTVFRIEDGVVERSGFQNAHQHSRLVGGQFARSGVEVGLAGSLDAKAVAAEVHGVGIHRQDFFLLIHHLYFGGDNPFLALDNNHPQTGNVAQQSRTVWGAHAEHVFCQLLGDGRRSAGLLVYDGVFHRSQYAAKIHTMMLVKALVLSIYQGFPEYGCHIFIFHRTAVLVVELAYQFAVGTVNLRRGTCWGMEYLIETGRLAEKTQEIDVHHTQVHQHKHNE